MREFFQDGPTLTNTYDGDPLLRSVLKRKLPAPDFAEIEPGLRKLGDRAVGEIAALGDRAEAQPPRHVPYDPWGRRIDAIEVSDAWKQLERIAAEEKLVATAYERRHGERSRVHQFARIYLYGPSSAIFTCPLAMTDGAARAIELYGDAALKEGALQRLTSADPAQAWTSGQWMTERTGGSDVSGTSTIARQEAGEWRLHGTKWFTSATTSQMAMTLARPEGAEPGSRGLSLFYLELRDPDGRLNGIRIHRLKDKLGTKALPTAELTLEGARARLVGGPGDGVRKISSLFNITRIWNACCAVGFMRRGTDLARSYALKRQAFGRPLIDHPLHAETLAWLETETQAAFHLVFRMAELLGKEETGKATPAESAMLRILTPVSKLFTAKQGVAVASEALECFGGAGYVEDTGLPRLLRDSQVLAIWEGTTNVLSLDMLRAIEKEDALTPLLRDALAQVEAVRAPSLAACVSAVRAACLRISELKPTQGGARELAMALGRTYAAALLVAHADWELASGSGSSATGAGSSEGELAAIVARRWCERGLVGDGLAPGDTRLHEAQLLARGR